MTEDEKDGNSPDLQDVTGESEHNQQQEKEVAPPVESRFWVSSGPFFYTTLFLVPPADTSANGFSVIELFDVDGKSAGVTRVKSSGGTLMIELSQLMTGCKEESGLHYGQLVIRSPHGFSHYCRIHNENRALLVPPIHYCQSGLPLFSPLTVGAGKDTFLGLINTGNEEAVLRCRFYYGRRTPEIDCRIPANGSRILHIESVFGGFVQLTEHELSHAYIRCMTRSSEPLGVHVIERSHAMDGKDFYTAVS